MRAEVPRAALSGFGRSLARMLESIVGGLAVAAVVAAAGLAWKRWQGRTKRHKGDLLL